MQEQDYIMRLIKEMVRTILKLIFDIDMDSPAEEMLSETKYGEVLKELLHMVDSGKHTVTALLFYAHLNKKDDDLLEKNNFSREEIVMGLKAIISDYGLGDIAEAFLSEM